MNDVVCFSYMFCLCVFSPQVTRKLYFQLPLVPMGGSWPVGLGIPLFVYGTLIPRHHCLHAQVENLCHITLLACLFLIVEVSVADYCEKIKFTLYAHVSFWNFFNLSGRVIFFIGHFDDMLDLSLTILTKLKQA